MAEKIVAVMNKAISEGKIMNAIAHMFVTLGCHDFIKDDFVIYKDVEGKTHYPIAKAPMIILRGNHNKIVAARQQALAEGIKCVDFIETMTIGTSQEQLERTAKTSEAEKQYYGIVLKGDADKVSMVTKKFSLWQEKNNEISA